MLLAAGRSLRMGTNKLHLPWKGTTVLQSVLAALSVVNVAPRIAVVNGTDPLAEKLLSENGYTIVLNAEHCAGQGDSIRIGVTACRKIANACMSNRETDLANPLKNNVKLDGVLFSVADQPLLTGDTVRRLCDYFAELYDAESLATGEENIKSGGTKYIVRPLYGNEPGNPVLFGTHWLPTLLTLSGEEGGRRILRGEGKEWIRYVNVPDEEGLDVDTPQIYEELFEKFGR